MPVLERWINRTAELESALIDVLDSDERLAEYAGAVARLREEAARVYAALLREREAEVEVEVDRLREEIGRRPLAWYYAPWTMTQPWRLSVWRGGDEWERSTLVFQAGPLGCLVIADPRAR